MKSSNDNIGSIIKDHRIKKDLTQEKFAELIGKISKTFTDTKIT
jgi:transcriptional regulator with XRE-family HTH domain